MNWISLDLGFGCCSGRKQLLVSNGLKKATNEPKDTQGNYRRVENTTEFEGFHRSGLESDLSKLLVQLERKEAGGKRAFNQSEMATH